MRLFVVVLFTFFFISFVYASPYGQPYGQPYYDPYQQQPYYDYTYNQTPPASAPPPTPPPSTPAPTPSDQVIPHLDMDGVYYGPFSVYYSPYYYFGIGYGFFINGSASNYTLTYDGYYSLFAASSNSGALPLTAGLLLYNNGPHHLRAQGTFAYYMHNTPAADSNEGYMQRSLSLEIAYGYFIYKHLMIGTSGGLGFSRSHVAINTIGAIPVDYTSVQTNMYGTLSLFTEFVFAHRHVMGVSYAWNGVPFASFMSSNSESVDSSESIGFSLFTVYYKFLL